jgi:SAM-dependent methyltransferase
MSTGIFSSYARCYDLLYRDKDYAVEARRVEEWLRMGGASVGTLLDVGCGTGAHAREFSRLGWHVTGVDLSSAMLEIARTRSVGVGPVEFFEGAAADFDLRRKFSAAVSLFHVMSYQAAPGEAGRMLANIRRHLDRGGVFVFDFWHGPGVLADPPAIRIQRRSDPTTRLVRIAEPLHKPDEHLVEVRYEIFLEDLTLGRIERVNEQHRMRYFSLPELQALLRENGFELLRAHAGLMPAELHPQAWHGALLARAI